jgi:hypothetical protein
MVNFLFIRKIEKLDSLVQLGCGGSTTISMGMWGSPIETIRVEQAIPRIENLKRIKNNLDPP